MPVNTQQHSFKNWRWYFPSFIDKDIRRTVKSTLAIFKVNDICVSLIVLDSIARTNNPIRNYRRHYRVNGYSIPIDSVRQEVNLFTWRFGNIWSDIRRTFGCDISKSIIIGQNFQIFQKYTFDFRKYTSHQIRLLSHYKCNKS